MKKILSSIMALTLIIVSLFTLTGCKAVKDFSTDGVLSNGGLGVIKDGFMYYVAGGTDKLDTKDQKIIGVSSLYKRAVDESGNPVEGTEPTLLYSGIAGFKRGGIFAFGDYIYFTTPSKKVTSTAKKMTDRTSFARIRNDGKNFEVMYTTETADALTYAYYSYNKEELHIAILEGTELYSYDVKEDEIIEIDSDVTGAVFSNTFGQGTGADPYIFYTKTPSEDYLTQSGSMVYKTNVKGQNKTLISSGRDVSLLGNEYGYLYFSVDEKIYRATTNAGLEQNQVVSYKTYETVLFTPNGGLVGTNKETDTELVYVLWEDGSKLTSKILATNSGYVPYFVEGNTLYALNNDKKLVKLTLDGGETETAKDTLVVDAVTVELGVGQRPEKIGSKIYYFVETKSTDANGNEVATWDLNSVDAK